MLVQRCHNSAHLLVAQDLTINAQGYLDLIEEGVSDHMLEGEGINVERFGPSKVLQAIILLIFLPSQSRMLPYRERAHLKFAVALTYTTSQIAPSSCSAGCRRDHSTTPCTLERLAAEGIDQCSTRLEQRRHERQIETAAQKGHLESLEMRAG